jgi:competence protein ComEC
VLQLPSGRTWLLDAGTRSGFDVYRRTLQPFLRAMKLPPPTTAIVSHDNADHYNGLVELFRERRLGRLYLGPDWPATDASPLKGLVHDNQIELQRLRRGDVIQLDSATRLEVLWPPQEFQPASVNDTSLVCRITCSGKCVLLTGDIDEQAQSALLEDPDRLRADALLLPHHGGWETTLPDFVDAVHPGVILVSSHRDPHGPTTADDKVHDFYRRLHNRYRYASTARDGWIALQFGRSGLSLQTMRQRDRHRPPKK